MPLVGVYVNSMACLVVVRFIIGGVLFVLAGGCGGRVIYEESLEFIFFLWFCLPF